MRVGGETVKESPCVKNLGVLFDRHLSWDAHVSDVIRKSIGLLIGLRHLRHFLPRHAILSIVKGLVISRVRYCISVYGDGSAANHDKLLKVINFAARVVTGIKKYDHISRARDALGLHTPRMMCDLQTASVAHKAIAVGVPDSLAELFHTYAAARDCGRSTRQDRLLRPPGVRTAAGQRAFAYRAATLLNEMPEDVRSRTPSTFKLAAKRFLTDVT